MKAQNTTQQVVVNRQSSSAYVYAVVNGVVEMIKR